jgi:hypothetical protein
VTTPARKPTIRIANPSTRKPPRNPSFSEFISDDLRCDYCITAIFAIKEFLRSFSL